MSDQHVILYKEKITKSQSTLPIDKIIVSLATDLSRREIRKALDEGCVLLNGRRIRKASTLAKPGDLLEFRYRKTERKEREQRTPKISLHLETVLYQEDQVVAINKPPLLASQATKNPQDPHVPALMRELASECDTIDGEEFFLCHRLDKETSGVLLLATTAEKTEWIMNQFRERKTRKKYLAICHGIPDVKSWKKVCNLSPIDKRTGQVRVVNSGGKPSNTEFRLVKAFPEHQLSLIACLPQTGRGHQIRVHLDSCGYPILGDKRYGKKKHAPLPYEIEKESARHHMLHAEKLGFFPSEDSAMAWVEAPLPPGFQKILDILNS